MYWMLDQYTEAVHTVGNEQKDSTCTKMIAYTSDTVERVVHGKDVSDECITEHNISGIM